MSNILKRIERLEEIVGTAMEIKLILIGLVGKTNDDITALEYKDKRWNRLPGESYDELTDRVRADITDAGQNVAMIRVCYDETISLPTKES